MAEILVYAEHLEGKIKQVTLEALGAAKHLSGEESQISAVLIGDNISSLVEVLTAGGAKKVYLAEDPGLKFYSSEAYTGIIEDIAKETNPSVILMGASAMGKDLGPKLAARLSSAFIGDCIALESQEDACLIATRPMYAGKILSTVVSRQAEFQVATLRPNVFSANPPDKTAEAHIERYPVTSDFSSLKAKVKELVTAVASKVELTEAQIIVSGGRGLKDPKNFSLVEDLAQVLGAAVGASRAAVDAGWKPHSYQVGLTGKTVSPVLYIACGISGAIQHLAGMSSAKYIVAINNDPNAPIFKIANYGIVGDLFQVLPILTEEIKKIREV